MAVDHVFHDGETKAGAADGPRPAFIDAVEPFRQARQMFAGNSRPVIGDADDDTVRFETWVVARRPGRQFVHI